MRLGLIRLLVRLLAALLCAAATIPAPAAAAGTAGRPRGLAPVYQPAPYSQLQTFWIGANGAVRMVRKEHNGRWHQPYDVTPPGWGIPDSPVAAVWHGDQLHVFWVDGAGALGTVWSQDNVWKAPMKVSPAGYLAPGAQLAAVWQPAEGQLMVMGTDGNGVLKMASKPDVSSVFTTAWALSERLSAHGFGAPGGSIAAVYQPYDQRTWVFAVGRDGRISYSWKLKGGVWVSPRTAMSPGAAAPDAQLTAGWYRMQDQIEVFWVDPKGAAHVLFNARNGNWNTQTITGAGFGAPGSALSVAYQPLHEHFEVAAITPSGGLNLLWKENNGAWKRPQLLVENGTVPTRTVPRVVFQPEGNQLEIFYFDAVGQLWDTWKTNDGPWYKPFKLTDIGGDTLLKAGDCSVFFHRWSNHRIVADNYLMNECTRMMGIDAYCAARDSFIAVDLYDNGTRSRLICAPRSHPDSIGEQAEHIVRGVKEGLSDALVAAAPYLGPVTEGIGCASGVVFACAALALNVADQVNRATGNPLPGPVSDMLPVANRALSCSQGDYVSCASLGQDGVKKLTGVNIPATDLTELALAANDCRNGIVASCVQLGQKAVDAAGIPIVYVPKDATSLLGNAQKCLIEADRGAARAADADSCRALGLSIARAAGIDSRIVGGAASGLACANGNTGACTEIGLAAARGLVPARLSEAIRRNGAGCLGQNAGACLDIAVAAADAAGLPTGDIANLHACAGGDRGACEKLASKMTGMPFGTALDTATKVSKCADGDVVACVELGRDAARKYDPVRGTMMDSAYGVVTGRGLGDGPLKAQAAGDRDWGRGGHGGMAGPASVPPPAAQAVPPPMQPPPAVQPGRAAPVEPVQPAPVVQAAPAPAPAPVVVVTLPQGQCPAPTAVVREQLNIRDGAGGTVIGNVAGGTRVQCLACDARWCLIAANNPNASVSRPYLDFEMPRPAQAAPVPAPAQQEKPPVVVSAPPPPPGRPQKQEPAQQPARQQKQEPAVANFAGEWWVRTSTGIVYHFNITQQKNAVVGGFSDNFGGGAQFAGGVAGKSLTLQWTNNFGYSSVGAFTMHADGASFDGKFGPSRAPMFDSRPIYRVPGTWESFVPPPPKDDLPIDYGGCAACGPAKDDKPVVK